MAASLLHLLPGGRLTIPGRVCSDAHADTGLQKLIVNLPFLSLLTDVLGGERRSPNLIIN